MGFAIELILDDDLAAPFQACWERLAERGISTFMAHCGSRPHVTLCIYDDVDLEACKTQVDRIAASLRPVPLSVASVGVFLRADPVVFAAPVVTEGLLDFHGRVHEAISVLGGGATEYYLPGHWVPHVTLAMDYEPHRTPDVVSECADLGLPRHGYGVQLGVVGFPPIRYLHVRDLE